MIAMSVELATCMLGKAEMTLKPFGILYTFQSCSCRSSNEISATGVSVLAEQAVPLDELTPAALDALVADACEAAAVNSDKDAADKAVADLYAMRAATGI